MKPIAAWFKRTLRIFKRSLQLRVVIVAVVLGIAMVTIVGTFLTHNISGAIQDQHVIQLREQLGHVQERVIAKLSDTPAGSAESKLEVLAYVTDPLQNPQISGAQYVAAYQVKKGIQPIRSRFVEVATNLPTGVTAQSILSDSLLESVSGTTEIQWQLVELVGDKGGRPGLVMGLQIPDHSTGEVYAVFLVYSSQAEASTIETVRLSLIWAGIGLVALLVGIAWLGVRQVVLPVKQAARVAREVADGDLEQRMPVRGIDEMAKLSESFNDMALSLVDKIQEMEALTHHQQAFISDVAHELRTPITTIHMAADVIFQQSDDFDPVLARTSKLLVAQVERFESLLADLLEMSRFDAGAAELNIETTDIHTVVQRVIDMVTPVADRQRSWLRVFPADSAAPAEIDSSRVERIIRNLVLNACEHGAGHPIDVEVGVNEHAVSVAVRDRGVGLSPEAIQRVFDRFWRGDSSRKRTIGGTGLGLSIAAKDAELHKGELAVWGVKDQGAVFRLTLPRVLGAPITESPLPLEQLAEDLAYLLDRDAPDRDETLVLAHAITGEYPRVAEATVGEETPQTKTTHTGSPVAVDPETASASASSPVYIAEPQVNGDTNEVGRITGALSNVYVEGTTPRTPLPSRRRGRHARRANSGESDE